MHTPIFIDGVALAKQGDKALRSIRPSVCPFVNLCALSAWPNAEKSNNPKSAAKKSHYQSSVFVCVSVISSADEVDQLLIKTHSGIKWPLIFYGKD